MPAIYSDERSCMHHLLNGIVVCQRGTLLALNFKRNLKRFKQGLARVNVIIFIKRNGFKSDPYACLIELFEIKRNISQKGGDVTQPCP